MTYFETKYCMGLIVNINVLHNWQWAVLMNRTYSPLEKKNMFAACVNIILVIEIHHNIKYMIQ